MKWALKVLAASLWLLLPVCSLQPQQDAPAFQEEELTQLSSNIKERLLSLKEESLSMSQQLEELSKSL